MKDIVLFGVQGSGKGTQAKLLTQAMPDVFSYFSSGDLFRSLTSSSNAIGNYVKDRIKQGSLIDDRVTNALFESYVYTLIDDAKFMLLDGYPRTQAQLELMMGILAKHKREIIGIQFILSDEEAFARMKERGRTDDSDEAISWRIEQFKTSTEPMISWFAENATLIQIDASPSIDAIHAHVMQSLD